MKIQQLFDSIYLIPVVLEHLERPTHETTRIIGEYSIDMREARDMKTLLEYHYSIVRDGFPATYHYGLLRTGLKEYFNKYLTEGYLRITENMTSEFSRHVLDFGAGEGHVAKWWKRRFKMDTVMTLDRQDSDLNVDFEQEPDWWKDHEGEFNMVILSEVLHCKTYLVQHYILETVHKILKPEGQLLIVEPVDFVMAYRIGKIKNSFDRHVLDEHHITEIMPSKFVKVNQLQIQKHKFYRYAKV